MQRYLGVCLAREHNVQRGGTGYLGVCPAREHNVQRGGTGYLGVCPAREHNAQRCGIELSRGLSSQETRIAALRDSTFIPEFVFFFLPKHSAEQGTEPGSQYTSG